METEESYRLRPSEKSPWGRRLDPPSCRCETPKASGWSGMSLGLVLFVITYRAIHRLAQFDASKAVVVRIELRVLVLEKITPAWLELVV